MDAGLFKLRANIERRGFMSAQSRHCHRRILSARGRITIIEGTGKAANSSPSSLHQQTVVIRCSSANCRSDS
jgi:hypothetical protein